VTLYADSSAVLAWLLGEPHGQAVQHLLEDAQMVVASDLTIVECDRTLIRATVAGDLSETRAGKLREGLARTAAGWHRLRLDRAVLERARHSFPREPLRTLDALHLASALAVREALPDFALLTLAERIRAAGAELGLAVAP
jgi:predicted nucleic acid-binding protein